MLDSTYNLFQTTNKHTNLIKENRTTNKQVVIPKKWRLHFEVPWQGSYGTWHLS